MNTPKYLEIAELLRIDIFVKHAKENQPLLVNHIAI